LGARTDRWLGALINAVDKLIRRNGEKLPQLPHQPSPDH
jgi:hypothetical protein